MRKLSLLYCFFLLFSWLLMACGESGNTPAPSNSFASSSGAIVQVPPTATVTAAAPAPTPTQAPASPTATATADPDPTGTPVPALATATPAPEPPTTTPKPTVQPSATPAARPTTRAAAPAVTTVRPTVVATARPAQPTATSAPYVNTGPLSEVVRGRTGQKRVAITLDAGAGADPFPKLISGINASGVKLTFFLTGSWAQQNPGYVQQIVSSGMEVANHSWSHADFTTLSNDAIKQEINKTEALLSQFTGRTTKPLFRAPYGARDSRVLQQVNALGYRSIYWTIDSLDSVGQPKTAQFLIDRITKQSDAQLDGQIVLMHIGSAATAEALPAIIKNLKSRGFQIVTVSKLLG